jgi:hypothetical protein
MCVYICIFLYMNRFNDKILNHRAFYDMYACTNVCIMSMYIGAMEHIIDTSHVHTHTCTYTHASI